MLYRKRPVVIDAMKLTIQDENAVLQWAKGFLYPSSILENSERVWKIKTLEGIMTARLNDYIIQGISGEFYPCKPDIFEATYEIVAPV